MDKKTAIIAVAIIAVLIAFAVLRQNNSPNEMKQAFLQKFQPIKSQYDAAKADGYNVSEAERLGLAAKQDFDKGNYAEANQLLDMALAALEKATTSADNYPPPTTAPPNTSFIPPNKSWIYDGAIYETHPYYYPGHSFKEITEQVPSLAELGVKTIYLMPVWEQPPGEGDYSLIYHIYDYYKINPAYGTPGELKELINTAHNAGIKILFDLVTCCTWKGTALWDMGGTFSMPLSELQTKAKEIGWILEYETVGTDNYVKYNCSLRNGKRFCDFGGLIAGDTVIPLQYPLVGWGFALDKAKPEAINYFTDVTTYYVKEYDIDGWRVDAPTNNWNSDIISGDHSSQALLRNVKTEITKIKPDAVLISEWPTIAVMEPADNPKAAELDEENAASYSYYFYNKISEIVKGKDLLSILAGETISYNRARIRFLESHDTYQRINAVSPQLNKPLTVLIATIPGIPMIQAGQEIGAKAEYFTNPAVNWTGGDYGLEKFYDTVFSIRGSSSALKYGDIKNVWKSGDNIYAYSRNYENETVVILINFQDKTAISVLNLPFKSGTILFDGLNNENIIVSDPSGFKVSIPAYSSRILIIKR